MPSKVVFYLFTLALCVLSQDEDNLDELSNVKAVRNAEFGVLLASFSAALVFTVVYYLRVGKEQGNLK
jgi:hypothetical protein